jgi:hypothetical protein
LAEASKHLSYEISMLIAMGHGLASQIAGDSALNSAMVECFTLHARSLLAFLYADNPRPDDMIAEDFVSDWARQRPPMPRALAPVHFRVGKEIAHLTHGRLSLTEETQQWRFVEMGTELLGVLAEFLNSVQDNCCGPCLAYHKARFSGAGGTA